MTCFFPTGRLDFLKRILRRCCIVLHYQWLSCHVYCIFFCNGIASRHTKQMFFFGDEGGSPTSLWCLLVSTSTFHWNHNPEHFHNLLHGNGILSILILHQHMFFLFFGHPSSPEWESLELWPARYWMSDATPHESMVLAEDAHRQWTGARWKICKKNVRCLFGKRALDIIFQQFCCLNYVYKWNEIVLVTKLWRYSTLVWKDWFWLQTTMSLQEDA